MGKVTTYGSVAKLTPQIKRLGNVAAGISPTDAVNKAQLDALQEGTVDVTRIELADAGTAAAPAITWDGDTDTGIYRIGANNMGITANGAKVVDIATTGVAVTGNVTVTGAVSNAAGTIIAGFYYPAAQNNITAGTGGAIVLTNYLTTINTDAGGDAFTLANSTQYGQLKKILLVVDGGGDAVITPTSLSGGTTITMNDATDYVILMWNGTAWVAIENSGCTIA
jgi:hypothetical protein